MNFSLETSLNFLREYQNDLLLVVILLFFGHFFLKWVVVKAILAGAVILGVVLGFGAQSLIKDFLSGLFIFFEPQYSIGDRVKIGDFEGIVYRVTMRSTVLKDDEGNRYYIANGTINNVTNLSQK